MTHQGSPYPLARVRTADVYNGQTVSCDGCSEVVVGEMCFHSSTMFGDQRGGFNLCRACFRKLRVVDRAALIGEATTVPGPGRRVRIVGLTAKPELNDLVGVVVQTERRDDDRVGVRIGERGYLVHNRNLLMVPSFVRIEDDVLRITTVDDAVITVDGDTVTRREIPLVELGWGPDDEHVVSVDGVAHSLTVYACAICLQAAPDARLHDHHPVRVCDACAAQLRGRACPFCRSEATTHDGRRDVVAFLDVPVGMSEVSFVAQVGALSASYELRLSDSCLEVVAKDNPLPMQDVGFGLTRGGGTFRGLDHAVAAHVVGNGKSCLLRPPHGCTTRLHQSYTASMAFVDVVPSDARLIRTCDEDANEPAYVDGLVALERAKFSLTERRVALCLCVVHEKKTKWMHVFFSRNQRMPGIVCVMPDPRGRSRETCVLIADFYDPRCWRVTLPAVNHNDSRAFAQQYT